MRVCVCGLTMCSSGGSGVGGMCATVTKEICAIQLCVVCLFFSPPFVCVFVPWRYYAILFFTCQMGLEMEIRRVVIIAPYLHINAHE